jgi:hypothetical protein
MTKLADLIRSADKNSIFIGDFNLPSVDWDTGTARNSDKIVVEAVEEMFMQQLVDFSTHTKRNILDLVITNVQERIVDVREEGRLGRSDHVMIAVEVSVPNNKQSLRCGKIGRERTGLAFNGSFAPGTGGRSCVTMTRKNPGQNLRQK